MRVDGKVKTPNYFIRKFIADRLKAGQSVPAHEIELFGYGALYTDNRERVDLDDPHSLIACDLLIGETS